MKTLLLFILLSTLGIIATAQESSLYNGNYKGSVTAGKAEYQYYETDEYERIFNGSFKYHALTNLYGLKLSIVGNFKNNMKHGEWTYTLYSDIISDDVAKVSGVYKNGNMDGNWEYWRSKDLESELIYSSNCNFEDNRFVGEFNLEGDYFSIHGSFDKNGFFDGIWKVKEHGYNYGNTYEEIRNYKNGYCYKLLFRDFSTGEILNKFDKSQYLDSIDIGDITRDTTILDNGVEYEIDIIDGDVIQSYFMDTHNENKGEITNIYTALGFWICNESMNCPFFMSPSPVQIDRGNFIYEIERGVNNFKFAFEKNIVKK